MNRMPSSDSCERLIAALRALIASHEAQLPEPFRQAGSAVAAAAAVSPPGGRAAAAVLRVVPDLAVPEDPGCARLLEAFRPAAPWLWWRQTYRVPEVDARFLENYAYAELLGPGASDTGGALAAGLLLLGPDTCYPPHRHEPQEIYLPLSGTAEWRRAAAPWARRRPGELIHHACNEAHAMRTGREPLLALYLWQGRDLAQRAQLIRGAA